MNKKYWDEYYLEKRGLQEPSSFAVDIFKLIDKPSAILELGCGNGRDSFYFAENGLQVYALDQSEIIINQIKRNNINPFFICENIEKIIDNFNYKVSNCYARFFLHALNENEENNAIKSIARILPKNGFFFSESRSVKSSLYGEGEHFSKDVYSTDHKRRFIRKNDLIIKLEQNGFSIENIVESDGLARFEDDNPVVIRIYAKKVSNI